MNKSLDIKCKPRASDGMTQKQRNTQDPKMLAIHPDLGASLQGPLCHAQVGLCVANVEPQLSEFQ